MEQAIDVKMQAYEEGVIDGRISAIRECKAILERDGNPFVIAGHINMLEVDAYVAGMRGRRGDEVKWCQSSQRENGVVEAQE